MIVVRRSEERRHIANKSQKSWMTFDWENKADPLQNGFGILKILNEQLLSPGNGFILHTHKDMVVITYVREGMIVYKGPLENPDPLLAREFHSGDATNEMKQYAINILPAEETSLFQSGLTRHEAVSNPDGIKKLFTYADRNGILKLIASPNGKEDSLSLRQDVEIYSTFIHKGNHMIHEMNINRSAWLHVVKGRILLENLDLKTGDGVGLSQELSVSFTAQEPTEILLFDMGDAVVQETELRPDKEPMILTV